MCKAGGLNSNQMSQEDWLCSGTGTGLCFNPLTRIWISAGSVGTEGTRGAEEWTGEGQGTDPRLGLEEGLSAQAVSYSRDSEGRKQPHPWNFNALPAL